MTLPNYDNWKTDYPEDDVPDELFDRLKEAILEWRRSHVNTLKNIVLDLEYELENICQDYGDAFKEMFLDAVHSLEWLIDEFESDEI